MITAALLAVTSFGPTVSYAEALSQRTALSKRECTNGPYSRNCWDTDHNIATDYDRKWPDTGKIVEVCCRYLCASGSTTFADIIFLQYYLEITNTTGAPDGFERSMMLVNGQFPGPTIQAGELIVKLEEP